jgi:hypothetical protein
MYADFPHDNPAAAASDALHRVGTSIAAGSFLFAVGLAAALLSLWHGARNLKRNLTLRLARG